MNRDHYHDFDRTYNEVPLATLRALAAWSLVHAPFGGLKLEHGYLAQELENQ